MSKNYESVAAVDHVANACSVVRMADFPRRATCVNASKRDDRRGVLLLYTGVRYERQIEAVEPDVYDGQERRRRRR
jgi:hypothetical protein